MSKRPGGQGFRYVYKEAGNHRVALLLHSGPTFFNFVPEWGNRRVYVTVMPLRKQSARGAWSRRFVALSALVLSAPLVACESRLEGGSDGSGEFDKGSTGDGPSEGAEVVTIGDVVCESHTAGRTPMRLVTAEQVRKLVPRLFPGVEAPSDIIAGFPQQLQAAGYDSNAGASVDAVHQERLLSLAESVSQDVMQRLDEFIDCAPSEECAFEFAEAYGRLAYGRSLNQQQLEELVALFRKGTTPEAGLRLLIQGLIVSPDTLYQFEVGEELDDGTRRLLGVEIASKLSFMLFGEGPDEALIEAAESGQLDTRAGVGEMARELLKDPRADGILSFFRQWLHFQHIGDKDADLFPEFTEEVAEAAVEESERFIKHVLFDGDARFSTLLNDTTAFVTPALASIYGVESTGANSPAPANDPIDPTGECNTTVGCSQLYEGATDCSNSGGGVCMCGDERCAETQAPTTATPQLANDTWSEIALEPSERAGLFTRIAFLAATGGTSETSHITRGVDLQSNILCIQIPEPSASIQDSFPLIPDDPDLVPRDVIALHQAEPACEACHVFIDGVGLGFENYDSIGAFRTEYPNGHLVDSEGDIHTNAVDSDIDGPFSGGPDFSSLVAESSHGRLCFSDNLFRYSLYRAPEPENCSLALAQEAFREGDYSVKELIVGLVQSPDFRFRGAHE
jgi:hypothetical protein